MRNFDVVKSCWHTVIKSWAALMVQSVCLGRNMMPQLYSGDHDIIFGSKIKSKITPGTRCRNG